MTHEQKRHHAKMIANSIQRGEDFYTLIGKDEIRQVMLPTPQLVGTGTQRQTYAMLKADEILQSLGL